MNNWGKIGKIIYTVILVIVLVFAVIVILSAIPFPNGLKMYVVKSGSMAPIIKSGDLIFSQKQELYNANDIITYIPRGENKNVESITHRIVEIKDGMYITKGDANPSEDSESVSLNQIKGKYRFRIPLFGYLVSFAKTTPGLILLIIIPGTIIIYGEIQNIISEIKKKKREEQKESVI